MHNLNSITKFPVMIVGSYRSGTTYLCAALAAKYNLRAKTEPTISLLKFKDARSIDELRLLIANENNKFVLKVQADQMNNIPEYHKIWEGESYKILVYRQNRIDQILSYYVARVSDIWNTSMSLSKYNTPESGYRNFPEKIITAEADYVYGQMIRVNEILEGMKDKADTIVSYEEIDFDFYVNDKDPVMCYKLPVLPNIDIVKKNLLHYYYTKGYAKHLNSKFVLQK